MARYTNDNPYTGNKLLVIACCGQSNSVGYGESFSYTVPSNDGLYQLGLYGSDNLQVIPLTTTPQNYQNLSNVTSDTKYPRAVTKSSKASYHLQLAYRLREAMLQNYDILIVPIAYGMTGFTNDTTDTMDIDNLTCSNTSKQFSWKAGLIFSQILVERLKYAMSLHPENILGGIIWLQGETDSDTDDHVSNHIVEFQNLVEYVEREMVDYKERSILKSVNKDMWYAPNSTIYWHKSLKFSDVYTNYKNYLGQDNLIAIPFDEQYTNANGGDGETSSTRNSHFRDMVVVGNAMADHLIKDEKFALPYRVLSETKNISTDISSFIDKNYANTYTRLLVSETGEITSNPHATESKQQVIWFDEQVQKFVLDNTAATQPFYLLFKDSDNQEYAILIDDTANTEGNFWKVYKLSDTSTYPITLTEVGNTADNNFKNVFSVLRYSKDGIANFPSQRQDVYGLGLNAEGSLLVINGYESNKLIATVGEDLPFKLGTVSDDKMVIYVNSKQDEEILNRVDKATIACEEAKASSDKIKTEFDATLPILATQTFVTDRLAVKANSDDVFTKTEVTELINNSIPEVDLSDYYPKGQLYTKTEVDDKINAISIDNVDLSGYYKKTETYSSTEIDDKISKIQAGESADLTNYYNKTEVDEKVATLNTSIAAKADQTSLTTVVESVQKTSTEFQGQLATMKTELTTASDTMTKSLTDMNGKITDLSSDVDTRIDTLTTSVQGVQTTMNNRIDTLTTNVQAVQKTLNETDTQLRADIDTINTKIPNTASSTNQLADKAYVIEQVQNSAARGISASATGDTFASYDALTAGPWYYQGATIDTPHQNDYAIVSQDANNDNKTVRYNYDGATWIKFMVYDTSGGSGFTPTTAQTAAMNSGITSTEVAQIATNKTDIANEKTARETGDTDLLAKITAESTTRETADTGLLAKITDETSNRTTAISTLTTRVEAEELARANGDTNVLSKVTDEQNARIAADNKLTQDVASNATDISNANAKITALETSVASKANTADVYTKTQADTTHNAITTRVSALETKDTTIEGQLAALATQVASMITKETVVNMIYPVGAIIHTLDTSYDPATTLGVGTWEKIQEGVFLEASSTTAGTEKAAGLPNITGYLENYDQSGRTALITNTGFNPSGCFGFYDGTYNVVADAVQATSGARCKNNRITFDASGSSSVYGGSTTVQPHSITVIIWKRTA
jgi:hypothetical protein